MHRHHHRHVAPVVTGIQPRQDTDQLPHVTGQAKPTLVRREPAYTESHAPKSTCHGNECGDGSTTTTATLPVVLGAVVPIVCAIVVLFFLHRRHVKKLRREDANDKHKSLDFGMDMVDPSRGNKGSPPIDNEKGFRNQHLKGMSLDVGHPYLVPPNMNSSRDSINTLSNSFRDDGKYRMATSFMQSENMSIRSQSRGPCEDGPSRFGSREEMDQGLLNNAQRMSRSSPPLHYPPPRNPQSPVEHGQEYSQLHLDLPRSSTPGLAAGSYNDPRASEISGAGTDMTDFRKDNGHLAGMVDRGSLALGAVPQPEPVNGPPNDHTNGQAYDIPNFPLPDSHVPHEPAQQTSTMQMPRISLPESDAPSDYTDDRRSAAMVPEVNVFGAEDVHQPAGLSETGPEFEDASQEQNLEVDTRRNTRRLTMGLRPLPPDDPADNPEQRANRIRSFYKEYFEENPPGRESIYYAEDYPPEFYEQAMYEDFYSPVPQPYAEPVGRRAMTPPPRAPPRFHGGPPHIPAESVGGYGAFGPADGAFSPAGPRAFSSASHRLPGMGPRKPMPPPEPLQELPTPHMLKNDTALMDAMNFAPGKNFRDQQEGRAASPMGGLRPFTPMAPARSPLATSFDELAAMPSPHALRKSGTFDNLDFAPPPRFKNDTASDAGSIRSNRSGISYTHMNNIRTGAYRVSRLPTDMVGTKDDLVTSLRPKWDMR